MKLRCVVCSSEYPALAVRYRCDCGGTLDVLPTPFDGTLQCFDQRLASKAPLDRSGVFRFRELVAPGLTAHVTRREGNTGLYDHPTVDAYCGVGVRLKHEGENPTGSFKDRGMCVAVSVAKQLGMAGVACASTGNTSASMAAYAASAGLDATVFIPDGEIAFGKLAQAMAYGSRTLQIAGDFDDAMRLVEQVCHERGLYLVNSVNPFRIEGQKAIGFELLQDLDWQVPDWIVLPGGNLGNNTAIAKGLMELHAGGLIDRLPRIGVIQAAGANPLYTAWTTGQDPVPLKADTVATAIKIGNPVSWRKSLRGLVATQGVVEQVSDAEILDAKAVVDAAGIGAEPASCATVAGIRKLVAAGVIQPGQTVTGVLTGHLLKDPDVVVKYHQGGHARSNAPTRCGATLDEVLAAL